MMVHTEQSSFVARRRFLLAKQPAVSLYHVEVFMPEEARKQAVALKFSRLEWTRHAQLELVNDRYGVLPAHSVPRCFFGVAWALVELEMTDGVATKYVFRRSVHDVKDRDLIIVLRPLDSTTALVVTCWTNLKTDTHKTLDRSKYDTN
jgi:hypothetical protein